MKQATQNTMNKFEAYLNQPDYSISTRTGYLSDVRLFCQWFEEIKKKGILLQNITPNDIREYIQYSLMVKQYTVSTIKRKLASISVFLEWSQENGFVEKSLVSEIQNIKPTSEQAQYLDEKEQQSLQRIIEKAIQSSDAHHSKHHLATRRDAYLVAFLLNTGLLPSELCQAKMQDVEFFEQKGKITIKGKGRKQRDVPLNQIARDALQAWTGIRAEDCPENDFLWPTMETAANGALSNQAIHKIVQKIGKKAGLENLTPYVLRHTFTKNLIAHRVELEQVAALLGYESLESLRIYLDDRDACFTKNDLEVAVESIA